MGHCLHFKTKNMTYKTNLQKLKNFVMIKFTEDTMVQPRDSEVSAQRARLYYTIIKYYDLFDL